MLKNDAFVIDNLEVHKKENTVIISVNPKIYPLDIVFSAAYIFIDKAYVIIDGDTDNLLLVRLKAKDQNTDIEQLGRDFNNELINYQYYNSQMLKNQAIRSAIIQRAFMTQSSMESIAEDKEKITVPWNEKILEEKRTIGKKKKRK
jgi:His-Xaa-Ser system protein HxsD